MLMSPAFTTHDRFEVLRALLSALYYRASLFFFFSSRRRHTRLQGDWSSDVCSSDLARKSASCRRSGCSGGTCLNTTSLTRSCPRTNRARAVKTASSVVISSTVKVRSEERRVGKECRSRGGREQVAENGERIRDNAQI